MVRSWSEEIAQARKIVASILNELDSAVQCLTDGDRGFLNDTMDVMLLKGTEKAFVVVTFEAWTNARADRLQMRQALTRILKELQTRPDSVFHVTSKGVGKIPLGTEGPELERWENWQRFEDAAMGVEADRIAEEFFKSQGRR